LVKKKVYKASKFLTGAAAAGVRKKQEQQQLGASIIKIIRK